MISIPEFLYRGDSDSKQERHLHELYNPNINGGYSSSGLLMTNLNNSGKGKAIFDTSFQELVQSHVSPGWEKTHFLSFSECEERAKFFGSGGKEYFPYMGENKWDFLLLTFSLNCMTSIYKKEIFHGVYYIEYDTSRIEFNFKAKILLMNLKEYLKELKRLNINILPEQIENVNRDKEWLILPINEFAKGEFSYKIATECINQIDYYTCINQ